MKCLLWFLLQSEVAKGSNLILAADSSVMATKGWSVFLDNVKTWAFTLKEVGSQENFEQRCVIRLTFRKV